MARQRRQSLGVVGARTAATHSADEHITSEPAFIAARPLSEGGADLPRQPISGAAIPTATRIWRAAGGHTDARSKGMPRAAARASTRPLLRPLFRRAGSGGCLRRHQSSSMLARPQQACIHMQHPRWLRPCSGTQVAHTGMWGLDVERGKITRRNRARGGSDHEEDGRGRRGRRRRRRRVYLCVRVLCAGRTRCAAARGASGPMRRRPRS